MYVAMCGDVGAIVECEVNVYFVWSWLIFHLLVLLQALKNLVFLARVFHRSQPKGIFPENVGHGDGAVQSVGGTSDEENGEEEEVVISTTTAVAKGGKPRDLLWLIQKICRIATLEAGNHPKEPLKVSI